MKVAAVYVVYEDSGYLTESVRRVYYCVDKILFLLNFNPWNGTPNDAGLVDTYRTILNMYDPLKKIEIVSESWKTEEDQRNFGLHHLKRNDIDWCFIIDDDEMYNFTDLSKQIDRIKTDTNSVYLSPHQVYWKTRHWAIGNLVEALPSFTRTDGSVYFTKARAVMVERGNTWHTFTPNELICHHLSYVRSDEKMLRKIRTFSHAEDIKDVWYDRIWMKWTPAMEKIHPNQDNPGSFTKAIDAQKLSRKLEPLRIGAGSVLETALRESRSVSKPDLNWLKYTGFSIVEPVYQLLYLLLQEKEGLFLEVGTTNASLYFTACEAILKSQRKSQARCVPVAEPARYRNETYAAFSQPITMSQVTPNSVDWLHLAEGKLSSSDCAEAIQSLKEGGFLFITGTLTSKKDIFEKYRKGRNYYEYKIGEGLGVIEW